MGESIVMKYFYITLHIAPWMKKPEDVTIIQPYNYLKIKIKHNFYAN